MRTIDADALKELFSEVIGHIAKKPEMNGNLEHMIRASAMVIQMIDDAPSIQPEQRWIPVSEIPPRGRDLMLKIYDKHNLFYYYHMGFHDGEKYYTYNFFWWEDKDLEIVGWQLCPWEEGEQE